MTQRVLITAGASGIGLAIAALAVFLAGSHARTISGQMFPIDGDSKSSRRLRAR
jgi:NAD(P)-dependent dehydrogenase (short-subunit alcohol dehydrogenase family)